MSLPACRNISDEEPWLEKCGYSLACVLRNGVRHQVSSTGGKDTTNIILHTEHSQAGYVRLFTTTHTDLEDYILLTVACEDYEVSHSTYM